MKASEFLNNKGYPFENYGQLAFLLDEYANNVLEEVMTKSSTVEEMVEELESRREELKSKKLV